jgi:hypothetical protein
MKVPMTRAAPIVEVDSQFEAGLRGLNEIPLIDAKHLVEELNGRNGRFAHPHSADLIRFDQRDPLRILHRMRQRGRGHPAGGATADDYVVHRASPL